MQSQNGFTLIEVLVTLLIVTTSLLGLAGVQFWSLKNANHTHYRTQATFYAYSMAELMRSNPKGVAAGAYLQAQHVEPDCTIGCDPVQMAQRHRYEWNQSIRQPVEQGGLSKRALGRIEQDAQYDRYYTITVHWYEQDQSTAIKNKTDAVKEQIVSLRVRT